MGGSGDRKAVELLRGYKDGASVKIGLGPSSSQPMARKIADLFELAGWECSLGNVAQEVIPGTPYREGIEVSGVTEHLVVEVVAAALKEARLPDVRTSIVENEIEASNPKHSYVVRRIRVHVGHLESKAESGQKRRLTISAEVATIVGIPLGGVVAYLITAGLRELVAILMPVLPRTPGSLARAFLAIGTLGTPRRPRPACRPRTSWPGWGTTRTMTTARPAVRCRWPSTATALR